MVYIVAGPLQGHENSGSITSTNSSGLYNLGTVNELINRQVLAFHRRIVTDCKMTARSLGL